MSDDVNHLRDGIAQVLIEEAEYQEELAGRDAQAAAGELPLGDKSLAASYAIHAVICNSTAGRLRFIADRIGEL